MRLLTKLELDKLIRRKYLLLGGLLLLGYSSFMFFSCCMNSSPTFPVETADGVEVTGRAAALYNKSVYEQYAGELTDEAVAHVLDDFVDLRDAHGEHSFNWPVIYDNFSIFRAADQADRERSEYGYISVADAGVLSFHSPLVFSFDYTWQTAFNILFNSNVVFAIFLLIVLAPVFSEEYSSGAANVILSTRYGKSKVIQAKFTAAFLIAAISAVIFCVVILLACGAYFAGLECGYSNAVYVKSSANPHPYEQLAVFPCCYAFLLAIRCWNCCAGLLLFGSMQEVTHSVDYERCALFPSLFPDEVRRCTW